MSGHIPESFIEELLTRVDIVEVINARIPLRRQGANHVARCPFHTEKSPSFTVSPAKQFYHCFGCGAHGNALRFLMEFEGTHFVEACEDLASRVGLAMPVAEKEEFIPRHKAIFNLLEEASLLFQKQLRPPAGKEAIEYLKSRGLTGLTAKTFAIGYTKEGSQNLVQALGKDKKTLQDLITAGLVVSKEDGRYYDRFRDRIMFPIRDRRGRVLGFGGRVLKNGMPKYLNSPETPVFNKGQEVYGLYEARLKNRHLSSLIVVEGYIDVLCLAQFGVENVVATLGTAVTEKHLELLFRQVSELYFCFDGDTAGRAAAKRAFISSLPHMKEGRRVKFVFLPNGEDPDTFIRRQGKEAFLDLLQHATSLSDYLFDSVSATLDLNSIDGRTELVTKAKPLIEKLPKGVLQQMMFERLTELSGLSSEPWKRRGGKQDFSKQKSGQNRNPPPTSAIQAIAMLLDHRNLLSLIAEPHGFDQIDIPGTSLLCAIIGILRKDPMASVESMLALMSEECANYFKSIDLNSVSRLVPDEGIEAEFNGAIARLKERVEEQAVEVLLGKAKSNTLTSSEKIQLKELIEQKAKDRVD